MSLITSWEVIKYGPASKAYPPKYVCPLIDSKEFKLFKNCFGKDFYKTLIAGKTDVSGASEYNPIESYDENDIVIYDGVLFISLEDGNTVAPYEDDEENPKWGEVQKFVEPKFNELWEGHLRQYLSFVITMSSARYATHQLTDKGILEYSDLDGTKKTVSKSSLIDYKKETIDDSNDMKELMLDWIIEQHQAFQEDEDTGFDFSEIEFIKTDYCGKTKNGCGVKEHRRSRRFAFRV